MTCHIGYLAKYCVVCLNDSGSYLEKEGLTSKNVAKAKLHHWVVYLIPTELEKRTKKVAQRVRILSIEAAILDLVLVNAKYRNFQSCSLLTIDYLLLFDVVPAK